MRQPLVAANWKMHGSQQQCKTLVAAIQHSLQAQKKVEVVLCPPFTLVPLTAELLSKGEMRCGGQDLSMHEEGAYTGDISGAMLRDYGCRYVIVGHSERRRDHGENDAVVAMKFAAAHKAGLTPILCIGETLTDREAGQTEKVVARQLDAVLQKNSIDLVAKSVIAYEPVWAIGTGRTATPAQAQEVHAFIRATLERLEVTAAQRCRIVYGGSVKANNAADLFKQRDIDGGLVGGASLDAAEFTAICLAMQKD